MSNLSGTHMIEKGKGRLYDHLYPLITLYGCVNVALVYLARGHAKFKLGDYGEAECNQFPLKVRHPSGGLVEAALAGTPVEAFPLEVLPLPLATIPNSVATSAFQDIVTNVISPIFVNYFENQVPWLDAHISTDTYQWPGVWNFARVVRNAASHAGTLNWRNPKAAPVQWHHITYSADDKGRRVVGGDLILGDLLILMLELDTELDRLGCLT